MRYRTSDYLPSYKTEGALSVFLKSLIIEVITNTMISNIPRLKQNGGPKDRKVGIQDTDYC